jgi:hypothetical protein
MRDKISKLLSCLLITLSLSVLSIAAVAQQIYTGHDNTPRLRGVNVGYALSASQLSDLSTNWGGPNVIRYQLTYYGTYASYFQASGYGNNDSSDVSTAAFNDYDSWLTNEIYNSGSDLHNLINYCRPLGIKVLIDLHTSPGGVTSSGTSRIFMYQQEYAELQTKWQNMAWQFRNEPVVWGYDICNEPIDYPMGSVTQSQLQWTWNAEDLAIAQIIRSNDTTNANGQPAHSIIVETPGGNDVDF